MASGGQGKGPLRWIQEQYSRVKKYVPSMSELFMINDDSPSCLSCGKRLPEGRPPGYCSARCYWDSLQKFRLQLSKERKGEFMCAFESCDKPCYIDYSGGTRRIHDYCGKQHAEKHRERIETVWPGSYQSLNIATHYQYPSSHCDRFQQHHHHGGHHYQGGHHHHGYQLRSQTDSGHGPILFYDRDQPYYEFTNFAEYEIVIDGIRYRTSEHYFQSQKLIGTPFLRKLCEFPRPRQAFEYPRQPHVSAWVRQDWHMVKEDIMYRALIAKFTRHAHLRRRLLSTGDRMLVEHSPYDSYWGDGPDGNGLNRLGELLMRLRSALRGERKGIAKKDGMEVKVGDLIEFDGVERKQVTRKEQDCHSNVQEEEKREDSPTQSGSGDDYSSKTTSGQLKRKIRLAANLNPTTSDAPQLPPVLSGDNGGNRGMLLETSAPKDSQQQAYTGAHTPQASGSPEDIFLKTPAGTTGTTGDDADDEELMDTT